MTSKWSKGRIIYLGVGIVLVIAGIWLLLPSLMGS